MSSETRFDCASLRYQLHCFPRITWWARIYDSVTCYQNTAHSLHITQPWCSSNKQLFCSALPPEIVPLRQIANRKDICDTQMPHISRSHDPDLPWTQNQMTALSKKTVHQLCLLNLYASAFRQAGTYINGLTCGWEISTTQTRMWGQRCAITAMVGPPTYPAPMQQM